VIGPRRGRALLAPVAAVLLLAGCGGPSTSDAGPPAPPAPPVAACVTADEQRSGSVALPLAGNGRLDAVVLGNGDVGVLLANQSEGDLCQWKSGFAARLVQRGYRVLVFNYSGAQPPDADVVAAAAALRQAGAGRVFLVGASKGGTAVLAAAAHVQPAVAGVISISAPRNFGGTYALSEVPALTAPALFVAAELDQPFADDAQALYDACGSPAKQISIQPGGQHGTALLSAPVDGLVEAFLAGH
jgi:hypothetical protein